MLSYSTYSAVVLIEIVKNLNIDWYELTNRDDVPFVFYSDGFSNAISFKEDVIWNSDDDEFDYEEDETTIDKDKLIKVLINKLSSLSFDLNLFVKSKQENKNT